MLQSADDAVEDVLPEHVRKEGGGGSVLGFGRCV